MLLKKSRLPSLASVGVLVLVGCSGPSSPGVGASTGGADAGGSFGMGGGVAAGGGNSAGGAPSASGGSAAAGATTALGGSPASGGANVTGGSTGSGGSTATGGASGSGGTSARGGSPASGGTSAGGAAPNGGAPSAGAPTTGGRTASGGNASGGSTGSGGNASGGAAGGAAKFHVFLLLGQSNMEGYPKAQQVDRVEDPRVRVLGYDDCAATGRQKDKWDTAAPPLHSCWNDGLGPGDYFAKTLLSSIPAADSIGLVPCAINGEKIETFLKVGGAKYSWIVQRAKLAQQAGGVIDGILFHQGESNNQDSTWPGKVNTLVKDLKADLGLGNVPFLAGELLYTGSCAAHNTLINQLPSVVSNAFVVSASGLVEDPADTTYNLHFDHDSQVTFGKRYAEKMKSALGW